MSGGNTGAQSELENIQKLDCFLNTLQSNCLVWRSAVDAKLSQQHRPPSTYIEIISMKCTHIRMLLVFFLSLFAELRASRKTVFRFLSSFSIEIEIEII